MPKTKIKKREIEFTKTFTKEGTFQSLYEAQGWLSANGYSYGSLCRNDPVGLLKGDVTIGKWKNFDKEDIAALDGIMTSWDFRESPVTITIYKSIQP